jgi:phage-related baseplate assembly protein
MTGTIDLSQLPAPQVVQVLNYETIFAQMLAALQTYDPTFTALVESDPAYKIMEICAYREMLVRQEVNEAAQAVMLAYATGSDLDQLAALFGVTRLVITPANPDTFPATPAVMESDTALRSRLQLSLDGFSTAGPVGAYQFWALSAAGTIKDASVVGPPTVSPGDVVVTIMSNSYVNPANGLVDGTASAAEIAAVVAALNAQSVRPLTDQVTVQSVTVTTYSITAEIFVGDGPDGATVLTSAQAAVAALVAARSKVGLPVYLNSIIGALMVPGVTNVTVTAPTEDVAIDYHHTAFCPAANINITLGGIES